MFEIPLNEFKAQSGLPDSATFCGYVVHLPDSDEFLAGIQSGHAIVKRVFAKTPELAKLYESYHAAERDSTTCTQRAVVALLFDVGNHLVVVPDGE